MLESLVFFVKKVLQSLPTISFQRWNTESVARTCMNVVALFLQRNVQSTHVLCTHVDGPTTFWGQMKDDRVSLEMQQLIDKLRLVSPTSSAVVGRPPLDRVRGSAMPVKWVWPACIGDNALGKFMWIATLPLYKIWFCLQVSSQAKCCMRFCLPGKLFTFSSCVELFFSFFLAPCGLHHRDSNDGRRSTV